MFRQTKVPRINTHFACKDFQREPQSALLLGLSSRDSFDPMTPKCVRTVSKNQDCSPVDQMIFKVWAIQMDSMLQSQRDWLMQVMSVDINSHNHIEAMQSDLEEMVRENQRLQYENKSLRSFAKHSFS